MANPQKENGYTPIANEIMDAFVSFRVPGELRQVLDFVIRKTYGFQKKSDNISNSQIIQMSGLSKGNVSRALSKLITHKLVIKTDNFTKGKLLIFNKDYEEWIPFVIKVDNSKKLSKRISGVIKTDNKKLSKVRDTKETTKETIQKKEVQAPSLLTKSFFKGVSDLRSKIDSPEAGQTKMFLQELEKKYVQADKKILWWEIQLFHDYWTEHNHTGTKEKWQMQKTFEVARRLQTWFSRVKGFQEKQVVNKYQSSKVIIKT